MTHRVVNYTYGTGNQVLPDGSIDVRDGIDNLQSLDILMNADDDTYNQRDGDIVMTVAGALRKTGFKPGSGDFTTGFTVMPGDRNIAWYDPASKNWYSYLGVIPTAGHSVAPGINPVGDADWKPVTDQLLREELAEPDGVDLVGGAVSKDDLLALTSLFPITSLPSYVSSNVVQAWKDSVAAYGYVYFPGNNAASSYTVVGEDAAIFGSVVIVDDGVNLVFDDDRHPLIGSLKFRGQCKVTIAPKGFSATGGEVDYIRKSANLDRFPLKAKPIPFNECSFQTVISDTFTTGTLGSSSASAVLFDLSPGNVSGLFVPIDIGETITGHLKMQSGMATALAIMLRCANGWVKLSGAPGVAGGLAYTYKLKGQSVQTGPNSPIPMPSNSLASYAIGKASVGIALVGRNTVRVIVNGVAGYYPITTPAGDIYEVGFVAEGASNPSSGRVTGLCCYKTDDTRTYGAAPTYLRI